jgi:hypothetical protein
VGVLKKWQTKTQGWRPQCFLQVAPFIYPCVFGGLDDPATIPMSRDGLCHFLSCHAFLLPFSLSFVGADAIIEQKDFELRLPAGQAGIGDYAIVISKWCMIRQSVGGGWRSSRINVGLFALDECQWVQKV